MAKYKNRCVINAKVILVGLLNLLGFSCFDDRVFETSFSMTNEFL